MTSAATHLADIFSIIADAAWPDRKALPQAAETRFWRAADELRSQPLTTTAKELLASMGLSLFRLRLALLEQDRCAEVAILKSELTDAGARCLAELPLGCRLAITGK